MPAPIQDLQAVLQERARTRPTGSYTAGLLEEPERIQRKIMEEAFEVCLELGRTEANRQRVAEEAADLIFHLLVGLTSTGVSFNEVETVLQGRRR